MKVKDIMTDNVVSVSPEANLIEVAEVMSDHNIGVVPICDRNRLVGIITDRDIVLRNVAHGKDPRTTEVKEIMTSTLNSVSPDMDIEKASEIMAKYQVRRLPVVENDTIVGILSLGDIAVNELYEMEASEALCEISLPTR